MSLNAVLDWLTNSHNQILGGARRYNTQHSDTRGNLESESKNIAVESDERVASRYTRMRQHHERDQIDVEHLEKMKDQTLSSHEHRMSLLTMEKHEQFLTKTLKKAIKC